MGGDLSDHYLSDFLAPFCQEEEPVGGHLSHYYLSDFLTPFCEEEEPVDDHPSHHYSSVQIPELQWLLLLDNSWHWRRELLMVCRGRPYTK